MSPQRNLAMAPLLVAFVTNPSDRQAISRAAARDGYAAVFCPMPSRVLSELRSANARGVVWEMLPEHVPGVLRGVRAVRDDFEVPQLVRVDLHPETLVSLVELASIATA